MQVRARSYLTAGIALVGVGVVVLAPVTPKMPDVELPPLSASAPGLGLTTTTNSAEAWLKVFEHGFGDLTAGASVAAEPSPALRQFLDSQFGGATTAPAGTVAASQAFIDWTVGVVSSALEKLAVIAPQSDPVAATDALNTALGSVSLASSVLTEVLKLPLEITGKLVNVVSAVVNVNTMLSLLVASVGPLQAVVTAGVDTAETVFEKLNSGDEAAALSALVGAPLTLGTAFLNGYRDEDGTLYPGIFTVNTDNPSTGGIFQLLLITLPRAIATALGLGPATDGKVSSPEAASLASVASVPELDAPSVTVKVKRSGAASEAKAAAEAPEAAVTAAPDVTSPTVSAPIAKGGSKSGTDPKRAAAPSKSGDGAPSGTAKSSGSRTAKSGK